ncbi:hypothetical protein N0V82_005838 [Gnomoniopsis sp. IMI 355080]|nr:hypothetical protein N0V82_005838 [Gnomoniopsis sp. IMI 355080]
MKTRWLLLLPALSGCVSAELAGRNLMKSCHDVDLIGPGALYAACSAKDKNLDEAESKLDLNGCLGWGPSEELEKANVVGHRLFPSEDGNFTQYCGSCYIIQEGESATQVGHILCNCAEKDSDVTLEYMFDLNEIVEVNDDGCLTCGGAEVDCHRFEEKKAPASLEGLPITGSDNETDIYDCDGSVAAALKDYPNAIPKTYKARPIQPCSLKLGPGLCCYYPPGGEGYGTLGFHFIETQNFIYRIEYGRNDENGDYTVLRLVLRYCKYPESADKCPGGDPEVDAGPTVSDTPSPTNTSTSTVLSTILPQLSTSPPHAVELDSRGIGLPTATQYVTGIPDIYFLTPTMSTSVTGIPDIYFPTQTGTSEIPAFRKLASVSPRLASPELEIDFDNLDGLGLIDIMLAATNIEEVKAAHLHLTVSTDCFTNEKGKAECRKVVIGFAGSKLGNETGTDAIVPTSAMPTAISTHKTGSYTALATGLVKRLDTTLDPASSSTMPPPHFVDNVQAVLGPVVSTVGGQLKPMSKSKSKKSKQSKRTKTKARKVTKTELKPTTRTVTDSKNTVTLTQTQTIPGYTECKGTVLTTVGGSTAEPSVVVTYITEEPLMEDANRPSATETTSIFCGPKGCP